jgi:predicted TPR repeat methyltransferase
MIIIYLSQIFELINSRCQRKASFLFTTENDENNDFKLQKSGRYSHSTKYIESLSSTFNFDIIDFEISKIRKDKGKDIMGGIYLLKKN